MRPESETRFHALCEEASREKNGARLLRLVTEINQIIDDDLQREQDERRGAAAPNRNNRAAKQARDHASRG